MMAQSEFLTPSLFIESRGTHENIKLQSLLIYSSLFSLFTFFSFFIYSTVNYRNTFYILHFFTRPPPHQTYHSSPGGHSSCSSEPSPLSSGGGGSNNNNDSGVEMAALGGGGGGDGSFGELGVQEESPLVDSTVSGLQLRRATAGHGDAITVRLENIKRERLKSVRDSCHWGGATLQQLQAQRSSVKLPPIPAVGRCWGSTGGPLRVHWEFLMVKFQTFALKR